MGTVEKTPKQKRYERTAQDFERWLETNSDAPIKRKVGAFNSIADSHFRKVKTRKARKPTRK